jgi:hypothetical protein
LFPNYKYKCNGGGIGKKRTRLSTAEVTSIFAVGSGVDWATRGYKKDLRYRMHAQKANDFKQCVDISSRLNETCVSLT